MTWQQGKCCNFCGKELDLFDIQADFSIRKNPVGYGSVHDLESVDLRLCCGCFDLIVNTCMISPITSDGGDPEN